MSFRSGFIAVTGRANVGKSSLVNALVGDKVAIVSDKAQTTRNRITGILTRDTYQMVFLDTPGMHKPRNVLDERMKNTILSSFDSVDAVLFVVDISQGFGPGDLFMMEQIPDLSKTILVLNKIDLLTQENFTEKMELIPRINEFKDVVGLSAIYPETTAGLLKILYEMIPQGPMYYPEDQITDRDFRFTVEEVLREKALHYLDEEVPHGIAVVVEEFDREGDVLHIRAVFVLEKDSHKGIVIGKGGRKIKGIGRAARLELEELYGEKIMLEIFVKVRKDWRNSPTRLMEFGYKDE